MLNGVCLIRNGCQQENKLFKLEVYSGYYVKVLGVSHTGRRLSFDSWVSVGQSSVSHTLPESEIVCWSFSCIYSEDLSTTKFSQSMCIRLQFMDELAEAMNWDHIPTKADEIKRSDKKLKKNCTWLYLIKKTGEN
jgi:hypothetical protein